MYCKGCEIKLKFFRGAELQKGWEQLPYNKTYLSTCMKFQKVKPILNKEKKNKAEFNQTFLRFDTINQHRQIYLIVHSLKAKKIRSKKKNTFKRIKFNLNLFFVFS